MRALATPQPLSRPDSDIARTIACLSGAWIGILPIIVIYVASGGGFILNDLATAVAIHFDTPRLLSTPDSVWSQAMFHATLLVYGTAAATCFGAAFIGLRHRILRPLCIALAISGIALAGLSLSVGDAPSLLGKATYVLTAMLAVILMIQLFHMRSWHAMAWGLATANILHLFLISLLYIAFQNINLGAL